MLELLRFSRSSPATHQTLPRYSDNLEIMRKDGTWFDAELRSHPVFDERKTLVGHVISFNDISERVNNRRELELYKSGLEKMVEKRTRELEDARDEAMQSTRAKSEFLANMSHELRTPLNSIMGFSELLNSGMSGEVNEEQKIHLDIIYKSANHLLEIINDILDLSKIEAERVIINKTYFNFHLMLRELSTTFKAMSREKNLAFEIDYTDIPEIIYCDEVRLRQILVHLAENAIKFTPEGTIDIHARSEGSTCKIDLSDNGPGIPKNRLPHIFDAFVQSDGSDTRRYQGTGLGLTISRKYAELLGGKLDVHSIFGKGSTFTLRIPDAIPVAEQEAFSGQDSEEIEDSLHSY